MYGHRLDINSALVYSCQISDHHAMSNKSVEREKCFFRFPVPVRALEFGIARQVRPSRPASPLILHTPG